MSLSPDELAVKAPHFTAAYRLVPSRFPPVTIFDSLGDNADEVALLQALEGQTNDRLREELGALDNIAPGDRVYGDGTTPIMAAFTHVSPYGSRFSDGTFGVYYCADTPETAVDEVAHHRARFLRESREAPCQIHLRCYRGTLQRDLHDGIGHGLNEGILDPASYEESQAFAQALRARNAFGLTYPSVRRPGGYCAALFRPPAISPVEQTKHYRLNFDGKRITSVVTLSGYREIES